MAIVPKRAHDQPNPEDGYRVLVGRLWPRGVSKAAAQLDEWLREVGPSDQLWKAYDGGELNWGAFRRHYLSELNGHRDALHPLAERARRECVTLVFSARNQERNNAVVLKQYLQMPGPG